MKRLISQQPLLHRNARGTRCLGLAPEVLWWLRREVQPGWRTLETGCGLSTLMFGLSGAQHVCVTPDNDEVERVQSKAAAEGVDLARVTFEVGPSERVLPHLALGDLDLVLIDGSHSFPTPFMDWFYTASALRVGGLVVVDDVQIWTGDVLRKFLDAEPTWEIAAGWGNRTVAFRKVAEFDELTDWPDQPFVRNLSRTRPDWFSRLRRAGMLVRERDFQQLAARIRGLPRFRRFR